MTRDETVALLLQGREAWNAWAEKMLAERKALESAGSWETREDESGILQGGNNETRAWIDASTANFSSCRFLHADNPIDEIPEHPASHNMDIKLVRIQASSINFSDFVFPSTF
jgi:hypothetical protein